MKVDYIIRGGRVVDPSAGIDEIRDIYIKNMRIADLREKQQSAILTASLMHPESW